MERASWIRVCEIRPESTLYRFFRNFTVPEGARRLSLRVSADSRYKLFVNGRFVVEGPCHGTRYRRAYETVDVTPYVTVGENTVAVDVLHVTDGVWISLYREETAALWVDGTLTLSDGSEHKLVTDESWRCARYANRRFYEFPGFIRSIPPVEEWRGADRLEPVAIKVYSTATPETRCFNEYGVRETYPLVPRSIPNLVPGAPRSMTRIGEGETWADFDAGRYETAYIHLTLTAEEGTTVRLIAAECKSHLTADGRREKGLRDDPAGEITGPWDTLVFSESGSMTFDSFYWRAFRYLRVESDKPVRVTSLTFAPYYYPMGEEGKIETSDPRYNRMWEISRHTVMCCAHDNYVDCPFYEQQMYDMDTGLQMLFTLRMSGDTALPRKAISDLAASQLPDGMLQANYPSVVVQVIPSFSLFWILMLREYYRYTGDLAFVRSMIGTAEKVLTAFDNLRDERGLVGPTVYWPFVDWCPEWGNTGVPAGGTEEPLTVNTLLYAVALKATAALCNALGRRGQAEDYLSRARQANFDAKSYCYDADRRLFRNTPTRTEFSQHATLWAVLSGAVEGAEARQMMRDVMTQPVSRTTFSMNYYLLRALEKTELYDEYAPKVFEGWQNMLDLHCSTWCENPENPRSECHGWSAAPIYELSGAILGVYPEGDGFTRVRIAPRTHWFDEMEGTVPTPMGLIRVKWCRGAGRTMLSVTVPDPEKMNVTVAFEDSETRQTDTSATYML